MRFLRVQIMSDLHFEFMRDYGASFVSSLDPKGVDVLVLAGDIASLSSLEIAFRLFAARYPQIVFVAGNHEYYGASADKVSRFRNKISSEIENFYWLNEEVCEISGVRFVGTTLWYPATASAVRLSREWSDFNAIAGHARWVWAKCQRAKKFLEREARSGDVVVTHMLPSYRSVSDYYRGSETNCFFVCDVERIIAERSPALWVHGHTHDSLDYQFFDTRIVCNPFGYTGYGENQNFKDHFVIDVPVPSRSK